MKKKAEVLFYYNSTEKIAIFFFIVLYVAFLFSIYFYIL